MWWTQHMHDPKLLCEVKAVCIYMDGISHTCLDRQFTDWWRLQGSEKKGINPFLTYSASPVFLVRAVLKYSGFILWKYQTFHTVLKKWHVRRDRIMFRCFIHFKENDGFPSRLVTSFHSIQSKNFYVLYLFSSLVRRCWLVISPTSFPMYFVCWWEYFIWC